MKFFILLFILSFSYLCPAQVISDEKIANSTSASTAKIMGFLITSDDLERDNENEILTLTGNVKVIYKTQYFAMVYERPHD